VGVFVVVGSDSTQNYQVAVRPLFDSNRRDVNGWQIVGFLAAGLTYATALINELVYASDGAKEASAAGFILLSMVMVNFAFSHFPSLDVNHA